MVDSVTEPARERIVEELDQAPFPAVLAVWRSDQPLADLREQLAPFGWVQPS